MRWVAAVGRAVAAAALVAGCAGLPGVPRHAAAPASALVPSADAALLRRLVVAPEQDPGRYSRDAFDYPAGGVDSRGCDTRARVLMRDSTQPPQVTYPGCHVVAGRWVDPYTGTAYDDPSKVSIDHLVPLKEAYRSGAATWPSTRDVAFGNDLEHPEALKVVGGSGNASKGDKDPARWRPPDRTAWPAYAHAWLVVKVAYGLTADPAEAAALADMLGAAPRP